MEEDMKLRKIIDTTIKEYLNEQNNSVVLITNKYRKFDEDIFNELDDEELYGFLVMKGNKEIGIVRVEDDIEGIGIGYIFGLEVFEKNKGYGKKIMEKIFKTHPSQYSFVGKATKTSKKFWVKIGAEFDGDSCDFILNKSDFIPLVSPTHHLT